MASPFPGMDSYLEDREIWRSFHHHLAEDIVNVLNAQMSTRYYADVEIRSVIDEIGVETKDIYPDATVIEVAPQIRTSSPAVAIAGAPIQRPAVMPVPTKLRAVRVYETETRKLATSIELLSPVNKRGQGLTKYREKRRRILLSDVHLIEIDLLRGGQRPGWEVNDPPLDTDYVLLVNRANDGGVRVSEIWPVALDEPLPTIPVPLLPPDLDVALDMTLILRNIYQRAVYERRIDYTAPVPPPPLRPAMQARFAPQCQTQPTAASTGE